MENKRWMAVGLSELAKAQLLAAGIAGVAGAGDQGHQARFASADQVQPELDARQQGAVREAEVHIVHRGPRAAPAADGRSRSLPDAGGRRRLLQLYGRGLTGVDVDAIVERTDGATPACIEELTAGGRLAERILGFRPETGAEPRPGMPPGMPTGFPWTRGTG